MLGSQSVTFLTCQSSAVCFPSSASWCVWRRVSLCLRWHSDCDDSNLRIHIDTPRGKEPGLVGRLTSPWCLFTGYLTDASFHAQWLTKYTYHRRSPGVKLPAQGHSGATFQVISLPLLGPATDFNWTYSKLTLTGRVIFYIWHVKQLLTNSTNLWQVQWIVYPQKNSLLQMEMDFVSYPVAFFVHNLHLTLSGQSVAVASEADTSFLVSPIIWDINCCGWNEFVVYFTRWCLT